MHERTRPWRVSTTATSTDSDSTRAHSPRLAPSPTCTRTWAAAPPADAELEMSARAPRRSGSLLWPAMSVFVAAALAAILVGFTPSLSPVGLHPRTLSHGAAQGEVLVDTRSSQLAEVAPLGSDALKKAGQLAVSDALYLQSDQATLALGQAVGLKGRSVATSGPFTLLLGREAIAGERPTPPDPILVDHRFKVLLDVDGERPMLTIYAQAPTASAATTLVEAARQLLAHHVDEGQPARGSEPQSVTLRTLGPVIGGTVGKSARWQLMLFAFFAVGLLGASLLYARRLRRVRPARARAAREALGALDALDDPTGELDEWPHTRRVLPWALAGFMVMILLVPFDAVNLPVNLPLSSTADRPVLLGLIGLWLVSLAILSGEAKPRLRLTRVHVALFVFFGICCLGVVSGRSRARQHGRGLAFGQEACAARHLHRILRGRRLSHPAPRGPAFRRSDGRTGGASRDRDRGRVSPSRQRLLRTVGKGLAAQHPRRP